MSTSYTILNKEGLEIELDEQSNVFDLSLTVDRREATLCYYDDLMDHQKRVTTNRPDLTPEDLVGMALEMLKVVTYFEPTELHNLVDAYIDKQDTASRDWLRSEVLTHLSMAVR